MDPRGHQDIGEDMKREWETLGLKCLGFWSLLYRSMPVHRRRCSQISSSGRAKNFRKIPAHFGRRWDRISKARSNWLMLIREWRLDRSRHRWTQDRNHSCKCEAWRLGETRIHFRKWARNDFILWLGIRKNGYWKRLFYPSFLSWSSIVLSWRKNRCKNFETIFRRASILSIIFRKWEEDDWYHFRHWAVWRTSN